MRKRMAEVVAIALIGDGVVGTVIPIRHSRRWASEPASWRRPMQRFIDRPALTRVLSVGEMALGLWLATRGRL